MKGNSYHLKVRGKRVGVDDYGKKRSGFAV